MAIASLKTGDDCVQLGKNLVKARLLRRLTQKELAESCRLTQSEISKIEKGKRWPTVEQLVLMAQKMGISLQWLFTGDNRPGFDLRDIAIELKSLGIVDLFVPDARVPGAFRPPEQVVTWAVSGDLPDPRIVEVVPAVLAWNVWNAHLLTGYARTGDRRAVTRLAWLADIALTIHRGRGFPGGFVDPLPLSTFIRRTKARSAEDDLGRPATCVDELPPVSRRWNICYDANLERFHTRAEHLLSLRGDTVPGKNPHSVED